ncbi:MAG: hypothetical protein NTU73_14350 [Ignavibacteriae bacterium]|nr:hypothetical protein [Ignavibacteriota bacterium]
MKYLMVTIKGNAFNSCGLFEQVYPKKMLKDNITSDNAVPNSECIFLNKTLKKMFSGIFLNISRIENENIYFRIKITEEIQFDNNYNKYGGWYVLQDCNFENFKKIVKVGEKSIISYNSSLIPPFFS